ncbi:MAG TPA: elongation factor P [Patescibacteria group bacterium]|nr:elongation factor P [Patescibacteria group bacterium]
MASPNDIKKGTVVRYEGDLCVVIYFQRVSPGKGSSFVRTRMKNIRSGKVVEQNFKSAESLEFEEVQYKKMQYLYRDERLCTFMDNQTYEQVQLANDDVGDDVKYLKEGMEVMIIMHGETPLTIELPKKVPYKVVSAPPAVKGDSASGNVTKEVRLDNGLTVRAPIFVREGDVIVVNTDTGEYSERVSE